MRSQDMTRDLGNTARTLSQALPYMQRYNDATVVIKLGGHAMGSDEAMDEFARDVVLMRQVGVNPVIVHGGGPMINKMLERLQIKSEFKNGKRVTDAAAGVREAAMWLGRVMHLANNQPAAPRRDSEASRRSAGMRRRHGAGRRRTRSAPPPRTMACRGPLLACLEPLRERIRARVAAARSGSPDASLRPVADV